MSRSNLLTSTADSIGNTWLNTLSIIVIGEDARSNAKKIKKLKKQNKKLRKTIP